MSTSRDLTIHIDGAARGNPGPAAFAYVITGDGELPVEAAGRLGDTTNNVAEYTALVRALERALELGGDRLLIHSDSELLVKQMNGEYKVKNANLRELFDQAQKLSESFADVALQHVRREHNKRADQLCNDALDGKLSAGKVAAPKVARRTGGPAEPVRRELLQLLEAAAASWGNGQGQEPAALCEQLWEVLVKHGVVKK
jgi:ribonuclease HI